LGSDPALGAAGIYSPHQAIKAHNFVSYFDLEVKPVSDAFNSSPARVGDLLATTSLSRERIVIPTFQRGYMWKKKHVEAFWQDVDKQRLQSRTKGIDPHFFGRLSHYQIRQTESFGFLTVNNDLPRQQFCSASFAI